MSRLSLKYISLKLNQAMKIFKEVKNPISSYLFYMEYKNNVTIKTKKIGSFTFDSSQKKLFNSLLLVLPFLKESDKSECKSFYIQCSNDNHVIELDDYNVVNNECWIFAETYAENPYLYNDIHENDIIIDIGANVGDTALFFASEGLIVYGFEPEKNCMKLLWKMWMLTLNLKTE